MNRDEHLDWSKKRALAYLDKGEASQALSSILSDLMKFPGLMRHPGVAQLRETLIRRDPAEVRAVIEGLK
jgi:hypothetical protein